MRCKALIIQAYAHCRERYSLLSSTHTPGFVGVIQVPSFHAHLRTDQATFLDETAKVVHFASVARSGFDDCLRLAQFSAPLPLQTPTDRPGQDTWQLGLESLIEVLVSFGFGNLD